MTLRQGETGDTPEEIQTDKEISDWLRSNGEPPVQLPSPGDAVRVTVKREGDGRYTMADESPKLMDEPPSLPATPTGPKHAMERQPLHREYGGPNTGGTLCTCAIGADHSEAGIRVGFVQTVPNVLDEVATKLGKLVVDKANENVLLTVRQELILWADRFENVAAAHKKSKASDYEAMLQARWSASVWLEAANALRDRASLLGHPKEGKSGQEGTEQPRQAD